MVLLELTQVTEAVLLIIGAVLPVVNPLADAPIFLRMTLGCDESTRAFLASRIAFYSFFLLLGSLLLGSFVLQIFGISIPVVQVAGGAVVCALGWSLLADNFKATDVILDADHAKTFALGRVITPLTLPMTIDAGAISVAITVGANHAHSIKNTAIQLVAAVIGATIIALMILLIYRYAHRVSQYIGSIGMKVIVRLSAFIMLCIGVSISWSGIKALLLEVGIHSIVVTQ
ncbi:MAG: MarC family protein [Methylophilus sp.]|jgi:multiple antibiotic resistance protein